MERSEMLAALKKTERGLGARNMSLRDSAFWFDGEFVTASDEVVMYKMPCPFPIDGGLDAQLLLGVLESSTAQAVEILSNEGGVVKLKVGRTKIQLLLESNETRPLVVDTSGERKTVVVDEDFWYCLERASLSMGKNASFPSRLGITFWVDKELVLYATDNVSITKVTCVVNPDFLGDGFSIIVPPAFLKAVMKITTDKCIELAFTENTVEARFESNLIIRSRTLHGADREQFEQIIEPLLPEIAKGIAVPPSLLRCVQRTKAIATPTGYFSTFTVLDGVLSILSKNAAGEILDYITLTEKHPDAQVQIPPDKLEAALPFSDRILIGDAIIVAGPGSIGLFATVSN